MRADVTKAHIDPHDEANRQVMANPDAELLIEPDRHSFQYWHDVWQYRDLLFFLTWRDLLVRYKQTVIGAFREVADALADIEKFKAVRVEQEKQVAALAESVKLSIARYEGGLSSYIEVLDADQQYYNAQTLLARTQGAQLNYYVQLYRALGGGWQPEEVKK